MRQRFCADVAMGGNSGDVVKKKKSYFSYGPLDHAVAGITAGAIANISLHPLDVVKIRMQGKLPLQLLLLAMYMFLLSNPILLL